MADQVRTASELEKLEFNYFEAYQIPLDEKDVDAIKKKINMLCTKKANSSSPIDVRIGKDLKNDTIDVMSDPTKRAQEAKNCQRLRMEVIRKLVISLCARGVINKSEIQQIATKNKIELAELEKEIKPLLSKVKYVDDTQNVFDFSTYENIEKYLRGYQDGKIKSLFELLGLSEKCSLNEAKTKLDQEKRANASQMLKKTSDGVGLKSLYGEASKIFSGDQTRFTAYQKYVAIKETVFAPLKARKDNGMTTIFQDEYIEYVQIIAKTLGEKLPEAEQDMAGILKFCAIKLSGDADLGGKTIELCPYPDCGKPYIAGKDVKACPHCGRSFEVVCWNCKGSMPMSKSATACPHCGVTEKAQSQFVAQCNSVDQVMRNSKSTLAQLKTAVSALIAVVPSFNRVTTSETAKKISFYNAEIARKEKADQDNLKVFRDSVAEIDKQIALKTYKKAEVLLNELRKKIAGFNTSELDNYARIIAGEISKSNAFAETAKRYLASKNEGLAIDNAVKALEICADNVEAQQVMRKAPPASPSQVTCKTKNEKSAYIEWVPAQGLKLATYSVVRKVGVKPNSITDGTVIAKDITLNFFEDANISPATPYFYGVFTERYGIQSALSVNPTPVTIFPDVYDCKQDMIEGKIKVSWNTPSGVTAVKIRKNRGTSVPSMVSGTEIRAVNNQNFTDEDCDESGCSYFIWCEYTVGGAKRTSRGVQLFYKPYYIPKPVENVKIERIDEREFSVSGSNVTRNTKMYLFPLKPDIRTNKADSIDVFKGEAKNALELRLSGDNARGFSFIVPSEKSGYCYAVNANELLYACSEPVVITTARGISNVSFSENSGTLIINLNIVPQVMQVKAKVSNVAYAKSLTDDGMEYSFTAEQIKRSNSIALKLREESVSYVTLFAVVGDKLNQSVCIPVQLDEPIDYRKKQAVRFAIEYEPNPAKSTTATIKFESDTECTLPEFVLVKGMPKPMNRSAGELIAQIEAVELKKGMFTHGKFVGKITVKIPPMAKLAKLALVFADDKQKHGQMKEVKNI